MRHQRPGYYLALVTCYWIFLFATFSLCLSATDSHVVVEAFQSPHRFGPLRQHDLSPHILHLSSNSNNDDERDSFSRAISSALKDSIEVGDAVVCKRSLPSLGIDENSSYEVKSIYTQYFDEDTQQVVKEPLSCLDTTNYTSSTPKNQVYMTLYSPQYHSDDEAVVVTPEEVGLVSVREELGNAAWLAVPGFFWVFLAASFYSTYHERTGGSIGDALMGR